MFVRLPCLGVLRVVLLSRSGHRPPGGNPHLPPLPQGPPHSGEASPLPLSRDSLPGQYPTATNQQNFQKIPQIFPKISKSAKVKLKVTSGFKGGRSLETGELIHLLKK